MRKIFIVFFVAVFFLFNHSFYVIKAQNLDLLEELTQQDLDFLEKLTQTQQCGEIGQKCCSRILEIRLNVSPPSLPFPFNAVTDKGISVINSLLDNTINKAIGAFGRFLMSIFGIIEETFCHTGVPSSTNINNPDSCMCLGENRNLNNLCLNIKKIKEKEECLKCVGDGKNPGVWTALGICLHGEIDVFIKEVFFNLGISLAGIVALLCIIYAAFNLQTSSGNPEKIKKAQEILTSCIMGLMLIIFSVFILKLIGIDILRIPGFGK